VLAHVSHDFVDVPIDRERDVFPRFRRHSYNGFMRLMRASIGGIVLFVAASAAAAPSAPINLAVHYKRASVVITWQAPKEPVAEYRIYRSSQLIGTVPAKRPLSFKDTAVRPGRTYTYGVTAVDQSGQESQAATVRTNVP
jgi:fibronectin type 3 domain-containing protein